MGFFEDFMPFYPKRLRSQGKRPKFDVERALQVEMHPHPTMEQHRAENGELILVVQRPMFPGEAFLSRFFTLKRMRRVVLDRYGEFLLTEGFKPRTTLAQVARQMADEFDLEPENAKQGVIRMVKSLMLRGFVFLVRT